MAEHPKTEAIPTVFASCSIGCRPEHTLPEKLKAIVSNGFDGIELSLPDLVTLASANSLGKNVATNDYDELCKAAAEAKRLCDELGLSIVMLQPFANFEGWPRDSEERKDAFKRVDGWLRIIDACGADMLQVGSTDSPPDKMSTSRQDILEDLRELADKLAARNKRLAYENWCWSTHASTWKDIWEIVRDVNKPNIGLCLDTFQTAGSEWADPTTASGLIETKNPTTLKADFRSSMDELTRTIPPEKIYIFQISDAYKPRHPLSNKDEGGTRPRARWSAAYRPMPYDGGYLPVEAVTRAVLRTGFRGYMSMEVFDSGPDGKGKSYEMDEFAKKAQESMQNLIRACIPD